MSKSQRNSGETLRRILSQKTTMCLKGSNFCLKFEVYSFQGGASRWRSPSRFVHRRHDTNHSMGWFHSHIHTRYPETSTSRKWLSKLDDLLKSLLGKKGLEITMSIQFENWLFRMFQEFTIYKKIEKEKKEAKDEDILI